MCVLHEGQEHSSVSQFEIFLSKVDNESTSLYSSGKRIQTFGPIREIASVPSWPI